MKNSFFYGNTVFKIRRRSQSFAAEKINSPRRKQMLKICVFLAGMFSLLACQAVAIPLTVVNVSVPSINCIFSLTCNIMVNDTAGNIVLPGGGIGILQSRTYTGSFGSPAAGLFAYEYRLDLTRATTVTSNDCIASLTINFKNLVSTLDYDGNGGGDDVFVVTNTSLGTIGLASANEDFIGSKVTFTFQTPVCGGNAAGPGDTSYPFGLVSTTNPAMNLSAEVITTSGSSIKNIPAQTP